VGIAVWMLTVHGCPDLDKRLFRDIIKFDTLINAIINELY